MAETKPLKGVTPFAEFVPVADAVIEKIQKKVDFNINEHGAAELKQICNRFIANTTIYSPDNRPRSSNIKAALNSLLHKGKSDGPLPALLNALKEMDFATRSMLAMEQTWVSIKGLIDELEILNSAANDCLSFIEEDKGGPSSNMARTIFIKDLAGFYKKYTGEPLTVWHDGREKDIYYGSFLDLVVACLRETGHPPQSKSALGKAIVREINKKK